MGKMCALTLSYISIKIWHPGAGYQFVKKVTLRMFPDLNGNHKYIYIRAGSPVIISRPGLGPERVAS